MSNRLIGDPFPAPTRHLIKRVDPPSALSFLPPVEIHATSSNYTSHQALNSPSDSSGNEDIYSPPSPSPKRRSFRAPSPARFRDFFASESASSSPEKNARGLPQPSDGSPRSVYGESPKKRAMGPEQIIEKVEDSADGESYSFLLIENLANSSFACRRHRRSSRRHDRPRRPLLRPRRHARPQRLRRQYRSHVVSELPRQLRRPLRLPSPALAQV